MCTLRCISTEGAGAADREFVNAIAQQGSDSLAKDCVSNIRSGSVVRNAPKVVQPECFLQRHGRGSQGWTDIFG